MTVILPVPPVPDLARAAGDSVAELVEWFIDFYNTDGAPFNYRRGTKAVKAAYRGLHKLPLLLAGCSAEKTAVGRLSNSDVVKHAAPFAFDRTTQVFDLPPQRFRFGQNRSAGYRIPFLFVEQQIVHIYYLQPRKNAGLSFDQFCMVATIVKRYLLDREFYGQRCDIEFVDVGVPQGSKDRLPRKFNMQDLRLWSDQRLADRLTMINEALDLVASSGRVEERSRRGRRSEPDMPLFD